ARCTRELLYEQCSLHITLSTPSSAYEGSRPRRATRRACSSGESLCERTSSGVIVGSPGKGAGTLGAVIARGGSAPGERGETPSAAFRCSQKLPAAASPAVPGAA